MRRLIPTLLIIALTASLCACGNRAPESTEPPTLPPTQTQVTDPPVETDPPAPEHSELYLPDVSTEQMIEYFCEVVLDMEYAEGTGDATLVQKWEEPIRYQIYGAPTTQDLEILENLFAQLNDVPGFPGIAPASEGEYGNLTISFMSEGDFRLAFSDLLRGEIADGAVQFWYYNNTNDIYSGRIGYRTDISQQTRNSVLVEEIVNLMGFNDTTLREDSIVYQYSSDITELSPIDWVLVKLLYDPAIECGMNADQCKAVIEQLYY